VSESGADQSGDRSPHSKENAFMPTPPSSTRTPAVLGRKERITSGLGFLLVLLVCSTLFFGNSSLCKATAQSDSDSFSKSEKQTNPMAVKVEDENGKKSRPFYEALVKALKKRKTTLEAICPASDPVARRVLEDYGAMFIADKKVMPPPVCVFTGEDQVRSFQEKAGYRSETVGDADIELQPEAMKALLKARKEAQKEALDITPRDGAEAARRNFEDSLRLWDTRFLPALDYWQGQQRLTSEDVVRLRTLPLHNQIAEVLELERGGLFFSKDLSKSILYSIAAPGTSQHIAMLAFDVNEFDNPRVREILAKHGWFQTVLSDLPHFTFLGRKEKDLPKHGLKSVAVDGQTFWIPNVETPGG
jgi:hypothetical protein